MLPNEHRSSGRRLTWAPGSGINTHVNTHRCWQERHLAPIQTMCWWAEVAAGLSPRLDQFGVSHTSQRGYLPFSEVQRGDKRKESSHLMKGKRKKSHGHQAYRMGSRAPCCPGLLHSLTDPLTSFIHSQPTLMESSRSSKWSPARGTKMNMKHNTVPAPQDLTVWLGH